MATDPKQTVPPPPPPPDFSTSMQNPALRDGELKQAYAKLATSLATYRASLRTEKAVTPARAVELEQSLAYERQLHERAVKVFQQADEMLIKPTTTAQEKLAIRTAGTKLSALISEQVDAMIENKTGRPLLLEERFKAIQAEILAPYARQGGEAVGEGLLVVFGTLKDVTTSIYDTVRTEAPKLGDAARNAVKDPKGAAQAAAAKAGDAAKKAADAATDAAKKAGDAAENAAGKTGDGIKGFFGKVGNFFKSMFGEVAKSGGNIAGGIIGFVLAVAAGSLFGAGPLHLVFILLLAPMFAVLGAKNIGPHLDKFFGKKPTTPATATAPAVDGAAPAVAQAQQPATPEPVAHRAEQPGVNNGPADFTRPDNYARYVAQQMGQGHLGQQLADSGELSRQYDRRLPYAEANGADYASGVRPGHGRIQMGPLTVGWRHNAYSRN